jgi:hypothetical protein
MVFGTCALPPRWPPQCSCVVIESSFDPGERLQAPGSLWFKLLVSRFLAINIEGKIGQLTVRRTSSFIIKRKLKLERKKRYCSSGDQSLLLF